MSGKASTSSDQKTQRRTIYLVRHAESTWNEVVDESAVDAKKYRDADLSETGKKQLAVLESFIGGTDAGLETLGSVTAVVSSPLVRALRTAIVVRRAVQKARGIEIPLIVTADAREARKDISDCGSSKEELIKKFPELARELKSLPEKWWLDARCKKCEPLLECSDCVKKRVVSLQSQLGETTAVVSHRDLIRAFGDAGGTGDILIPNIGVAKVVLATRPEAEISKNT